jgi:hypothetical protein
MLRSHGAHVKQFPFLVPSFQSEGSGVTDRAPHLMLTVHHQSSGTLAGRQEMGRSYRDLIVWQKATALVTETYQASGASREKKSSA